MTLIVAAAVIERDGRFLVTRRQRGVPLEGLWEFPGGKCKEGETLGVALARELQEELGVAVTIGAELLKTVHAGEEHSVELHFFRCEILGKPRPILGQQMQWVARDDLRQLPFPSADAELIALLTNDSVATTPPLPSTHTTIPGAPES